jgi:hypothetical protein
LRSYLKNKLRTGDVWGEEGKNDTNIEKNIKKKRTGDMAQVLECLPSMYKVLDLISSKTHTHRNSPSKAQCFISPLYLFTKDVLKINTII